MAERQLRQASSPAKTTAAASTSATATAAAAEGTSAQEGSGPAPEKRKRGRPRKPKPEQPEEPKIKRPRGRPKGSKNKSPSKAAVLKSLTTSRRRGERSGRDNRLWPMLKAWATGGSGSQKEGEKEAGPSTSGAAPPSEETAEKPT